MTETTTPTPPEGLTDEQLFNLAAAVIYGYDSIAPGEYEGSTNCALAVYGSELLAAMRAAIAADRAARPAPTPEEIEAQFRAWFQQEHGLPPSATATANAAKFALHLLGGEVAA